MIVSIVCPSIDLVTNPLNDLDVNGANIAVWIQLRTFANHPAFECLELFLTPRDFADKDKIRRFAHALLALENRGKGKLSFHSVYAVGDVWADGLPRILHSDDLWALSRDRHLRDTYAKGPIAHLCDTHCIAHLSLHRSLNEVASLDHVDGDSIIACSRSTAAALKASYDLPYEVHWHHRRIDPSGLSPATPVERQAERARYGLPADGPLALYLGRVTPAMKGELMLLIDALVGHPGGLVITGVNNMPGYPEVLRAYAERRGVADRVFQFGRFAPGERAHWYRACDVFLFPADCLNEAFGQTTIEAMACGLPVVQSAWDGLKDTLHPDAGSLIPTYAAPAPERLEHLSVALETPSLFLALAQSTVIDREAWFQAQQAWMGDPERRRVGGRAARLLYEQSFAPEVLETSFVAMFKACLDRAKSGCRTPREVRVRALSVDYSVALDRYASCAWDPNTTFTEAKRGLEWRAGGDAPYIYGEIEPLLDPSLLAMIQERAARGPIKASRLASLLRGAATTERDAVYHAMFLAKQGFLKITRMDTSEDPSV